MWIPACWPLPTRSALGVTIRTMVFTECSLSLTHSSTRLTFSATSHTIVEMEAADTNTSRQIRSAAALHQQKHRSGGMFMKHSGFTFVYNVADGFCSQCVVQRDTHQWICVTCQLTDGPLHTHTHTHKKKQALKQNQLTQGKQEIKQRKHFRLYKRSHDSWREEAMTS